MGDCKLYYIQVILFLSFPISLLFLMILLLLCIITSMSSFCWVKIYLSSVG